MKKHTKILALALALVLTLALGVGGTLAWLAAKTDAVVNTFTYGNIDVALNETTGTKYDIVPGLDIQKDPKVTVSTPAGYQDTDAYVYVKLQEVNWPAVKEESGARKVSYTVAEGWNKLEGVPGVSNVYWRKVDAKAPVKTFQVLKDDQITVSGTLTKTDVEAAQQIGQPQLVLTAYAVQSGAMVDAKDAWTKAAFN